jgi:hypothetical protein
MATCRPYIMGRISEAPEHHPNLIPILTHCGIATSENVTNCTNVTNCIYKGNEVKKLLDNLDLLEEIDDEECKKFVTCFKGEFHDQGDAKWIVIKWQQRGHNNTPCGRPTPGGWLP